jgi:predicted outer membrane protein
MSVSVKTKAMALATGLSCLIATSAIAQPGQPGQPDRPPTQPRPGVGATSQQAMPQQPLQSTVRSENSEIDQFFAACLTNRNQGEVEIGKFAADRAQHPQVKQFAQLMVSDHQSMLPKLQQLTGIPSTTERPGGIQRTSFEAQANQPGGDQPTTTLGTPSQQVGGASGVAGQPGRQAQGTTTPQFGEPGGSQQPGQPGMVGQPGQSMNLPGIASRTGGGDQAIQQLIAIDRQIAENCTRNLREKLQGKQGAEFDMCYIGSQIAAHGEMLSALEVLKNKEKLQ